LEGVVFLIMQSAGFPPDLPMSSFQLIVAAGALLLVAAVLLGLRRTSNVAVQRSLLTDELMIYLGRIAEALERNSLPDKETILEEIERRTAERTDGKSGAKIHPMPYSMLGREFPEKK
jgi:hypothetical protein